MDFFQIIKNNNYFDPTFLGGFQLLSQITYSSIHPNDTHPVYFNIIIFYLIIYIASKITNMIWIYYYCTGLEAHISQVQSFYFADSDQLHPWLSFDRQLLKMPAKDSFLAEITFLWFPITPFIGNILISKTNIAYTSSEDLNSNNPFSFHSVPAELQYKVLTIISIFPFLILAIWFFVAWNIWDLYMISNEFL